MRLVIALGGNAMTGPDGDAGPAAQQAAVELAMEGVAELVAAGDEVVLTHGNGPQVGNLLTKNELASRVVPPVPLDWCVAQTQATIGLLMVTALERALAGRGAARPVAATVSRVLVDATDPAWRRPTKPIGRYVPEAEAREHMARGQHWEPRGARGWRRVVPSPEPRELLDREVVLALLERGVVVVAAGGGGVPMVAEDGRLRGVEAVLDKDLSAALLARTVGAECLVIATDVEHAATGWGTPEERPIGRVRPDELRALAAAGHFASGSMGPKVEAAARFVEGGGRRAVIGSLTRLADAAEGKTGTVVEP
jgi:carbamate kinase